MKISDLSSTLAVSEMTIHRDLKPLIEEGFVIKTFGGVTLSNKYKVLPQNACVYCQQNFNDKLAFRIVLNDGEIETTCCGHCGLLRFQQIHDQINQVMCLDFLLLTTINARRAHFVMNTSLNLGCCQPQVLPFEHKEEAEMFVKGFSGEIYTFNEAVNIVYQDMVSYND